MKYLRNVILPIFIAGIWINISEFLRNEFLAKSYWVDHYRGLNLIFPSEPVNGIGWVIWGFSFAIALFILSRRFTLWQTTFLAWFTAFFMMWIVIWNLDVLPGNILWMAAPLSFFETFVAVLICKQLSPREPLTSR